MEEKRIRAHHDKIVIRLFVEKRFKLGEGRNSEVYLGAYHAQEAVADDVAWSLCAIKRVQADRESQLGGLQEAFALRRLGPHPHIVRMIAVLDEMELLDGPPINAGDTPRLLIVLEHLPFSLAEFARTHATEINLRLWLSWARQLASTIEWLHARGCVHGDIKKENVLLTPDLSIKLCDFSSVLFSNAAEPATDCYSVGTPAFRAPELFYVSSWSPSDTGGEAHPALSFTLDIFSLGVLLYSLATGVDPGHRVKSVMEIRRRQKRFFMSEEDDRMERMTVQGMTPPSPPSPTRSRPVSREHGTPDLLPSIEHSLSTMNLQEAVLDQILDPAPEPHGVIVPPSLTATTTTKLMVPRVKRTSSYTSTHTRGDANALSRCASLSSRQNTISRLPQRRHISASEHIGTPSRGKPLSPRTPPNMRFALHDDSSSHEDSAAYIQAHTPPVLLLPESLKLVPEHDDRRPYADGVPALILPGGDRLPDTLRDLIKAMVSPRPDDRPLASHVCTVLNDFEMPL